MHSCNYEYQDAHSLISFIIKENEIFTDGMVMACLNSDVLHVNNQHTLTWTHLGKEMIITKASNISSTDIKVVKNA